MLFDGATEPDPVPVSADVCGLAPSPPLYDTLRVVERDPAAPGVNVTVNVQEFPVVSELPPAAQDPAPEFVIVKSAELPPVVVGVMLVAVTPLEFDSVKITGELDDPTFTIPKFWLDGERVTPALDV